MTATHETFEPKTVLHTFTKASQSHRRECPRIPALVRRLILARNPEILPFEISRLDGPEST